MTDLSTIDPKDAIIVQAMKQSNKHIGKDLEEQTSNSIKLVENLMSLMKIFVHDAEKHENTRELYYLALSTELFSDVTNHINKSNLVTIGNLNQSIIFEKPFAEDKLV